ncbi:hypothetical protein Trydic_g15114 [Trypoxylus dichotomus]
MYCYQPRTKEDSVPEKEPGAKEKLMSYRTIALCLMALRMRFSDTRLITDLYCYVDELVEPHIQQLGDPPRSKNSSKPIRKGPCQYPVMATQVS